MAIEELDPDAPGITAILDGIPGAYERARLGLERAHAGDMVSPDEL
jgi:hypothetical protein